MIGREGAYRKGQVDIAGWFAISADWVGIPEERYYLPFAWELKGPRGKTSLEQIADMKAASDAGATVAVIRSVDEALAALRGMGIDLEQPQGRD